MGREGETGVGVVRKGSKWGGEGGGNRGWGGEEGIKVGWGERGKQGLGW